MRKSYLVAFILLCSIAISCVQQAPGYRFDLFKNTPNWKLAKAVENEDAGLIKELLADGTLNVNLQEPKFGRTLLHLAIGNDKLVATKALLESGAQLTITDHQGKRAIHEVTEFIRLRHHSLQILELLLKYGANVNDTMMRMEKNDTAGIEMPLTYAVQDLACTKLLLSKGANAYVVEDKTYVVWNILLIMNIDESIFSARYMIVEKKMPVPNPISYSMPDNQPLDIFRYLEKNHFEGDIRKEKAKQEILTYLKKIHYPKNGVYSAKE